MKTRPVPRSLLRDSSTTSVAAMVAVASGLALDVAIAAAFGAGAQTDAYFAATRLPLGIITTATVAANQVALPAIATWRRRFGEDRAGVLSWQLLVVVMAGTGALAAVLGVLSGPLMAVLVPGYSAGTRALAASLMTWMLVAVPFSVGGEVLRAALNVRRSFVVPAASNLILNGVAIGLILVWDGDVSVVAIGYATGALLRFLVLAVLAGRESLAPAMPSLADPELRAVLTLSVRPSVGAALNPLARIGEQVVISFLPAGALSLLNYGYRLISAIGGTVFFRSVMVILMPSMTEAAADGNDQRVRRIAGRGVALMLLVSLPLTLVSVVLSHPATAVVFRRDNFTSADAAMLGTVVAVYALSLPASGLQRALLAPMYARLDTRTPLVNTVVGIVANLAMVAAFVALAPSPTAATIGVAAAYALAQATNVVHAVVALRGSIGLPTVVWTKVRDALLVPTVGCALLLIAGRLVYEAVQPRSLWQLVAVAGIAAISLFPYVLFARPVRSLFAMGPAPEVTT